MIRRRSVVMLASLLALVGLIGPGVAVATAPTIERTEVDEEFVDDLLTEACGVAVTTTARGHVITRFFPDEDTGVIELRTLNIALVARAGDRTFRFRDVGADLVRLEPDGTAVLSIIGQVPFAFAGVLTIDLATGDAILEPRDRSEQQIQRACSVLTGG